MAIAILIFFSAGVPLFLLMYLWTRRSEVEKALGKVRSNHTLAGEALRMPIEQFGFLFGGFKPETWFWENIVMVRKVAIVAISVFLRNNVFDQTIAALLVMYAALALQFKYSPFQQFRHNFAEYLSLITTVITLNGGIMGYGGWMASNDDATGNQRGVSRQRGIASTTNSHHCDRQPTGCVTATWN